MSTDLYGIRILKVVPEKRNVTLRVFVVYYDTEYESHQPLPLDHSFFLRILWDKGDTRFGEGGPIGAEISVDQYCDEDWVNKNTYRYVEDVIQLSTSNYPVEDYSIYEDFYYEDNGDWVDEENLVQSDYDLYVTDAKFLQHLSIGMSWGTTAYETKSFLLLKKYDSILPNLNEVTHTLIPFSGKSGGLKDMAFTPDGSKLLVLGLYEEIVAYESGTWKEIWRDKKGEEMFTYMNIDQKNQIVWLTTEGSILKVIDYNTGQKTAVKVESGARLVSPKGNYHVNFGDQEFLVFIDLKGKEKWQIDQPDVVEAVAFSKDESLIAIGGMYNSVSIWETGQQNEKIVFETNENTSCLSFNPTHEFLAIVSFHDLIIYNLNTKELVLKYYTDGDIYLGMPAWSEDGKYFALINGESISIYKLIQ